MFIYLSAYIFKILLELALKSEDSDPITNNLSFCTF